MIACNVKTRVTSFPTRLPMAPQSNEFGGSERDWKRETFGKGIRSASGVCSGRRDYLECAGKAKRRRRFGQATSHNSNPLYRLWTSYALDEVMLTSAIQSGVAL